MDIIGAQAIPLRGYALRSAAIAYAALFLIRNSECGIRNAEFGVTKPNIANCELRIDKKVYTC